MQTSLDRLPYRLAQGGLCLRFRHSIVRRQRIEGGADAADGVPRLPADELVEIYRAADAFVFPSLIETFGIVIVEAMAAGLPVIDSTTTPTLPASRPPAIPRIDRC